MNKIFLIVTFAVICAFSSEHSLIEHIQDSTRDTNHSHIEEHLAGDTLNIKNVQNESDSTPVQISNGSDGTFNPLTYQKRVMLSGCLHLFKHANYIAKDYVENNPNGYSLNTIGRRLKSNDNGFLTGLWIRYMKRFYPSGIFIRPQIQFCIGLDRYKYVYDANIFSDGSMYSSGDSLKQTFLFHLANDIGYCNTNYIVPFAIYTGIRLSYWNRDNAQLENNNTSSWGSSPIGLILYKPVGPRLALGLDVSTEIIFGVNEGATFYPDEEHRTIYPESLPFGQSYSYRFELTAEFLIKKWFSLQITQFVNIYKFKDDNSGKTITINSSEWDNSGEFPYNEPGSRTVMIGWNFTFTGLFSKDE